jgi:hypothetical protein
VHLPLLLARTVVGLELAGDAIHQCATVINRTAEPRSVRTLDARPLGIQPVSRGQRQGLSYGSDL